MIPLVFRVHHHKIPMRIKLIYTRWRSKVQNFWLWAICHSIHFAKNCVTFDHKSSTKNITFFSLKFSSLFRLKSEMSQLCKFKHCWIIDKKCDCIQIKEIDCISPWLVHIKVVMQGNLFQRCTHLLYCSVLSLGGNVYTRRMS